MTELAGPGSQLPAAVTGLSPEAVAAVRTGVPESTRRAYLSSLRQYEAWCEMTGRHGLPADAAALTEYATYLAYERGLAPGSIERARWAIVKWHALAGAAPPPTEGLVRVLKGYRAHLATTKSPKARPRKATPADRSTLFLMLAALDRDTPAGQRDAAIILTGFAIAARRGELSSLDIPDVSLSDRGMQIKVYREKTRLLDEPVVLPRRNAALCPVRAARTWIETLAGLGRSEGPLFVRIDRHGRLAVPLTRGGIPIGDPSGRMSAEAIGDVVTRLAEAACLDGTWTGHSLRRGLATAAHGAGAATRDIERQGGWMHGSRAVAGYIEDADRWITDILDGVL